MLFRVVDNRVQFPTHYVYATLTDQQIEQLQITIDRSNDRFICYGLVEKDAVVAELTRLGVAYTVKSLTWDMTTSNFFSDKIFPTRTAAINAANAAGISLIPQET
jgi:hypothetical protein